MDDFAESSATPSVVRVYFKGARKYWSLEWWVIENLAVSYVCSGTYAVSYVCSGTYYAYSRMRPICSPCETVPAYAKVRGYSGMPSFCHQYEW